jgi:hypothetical protein
MKIAFLTGFPQTIVSRFARRSKTNNCLYLLAKIMPEEKTDFTWLFLFDGAQSFAVCGLEKVIFANCGCLSGRE